MFIDFHVQTLISNIELFILCNACQMISLRLSIDITNQTETPTILYKNNLFAKRIKSLKQDSVPTKYNDLLKEANL